MLRGFLCGGGARAAASCSTTTEKTYTGKEERWLLWFTAVVIHPEEERLCGSAARRWQEKLARAVLVVLVEGGWKANDEECTVSIAGVESGGTRSPKHVDGPFIHPHAHSSTRTITFFATDPLP